MRFKPEGACLSRLGLGSQHLIRPDEGFSATNHLSIAEKTVKNHVSNILKALQVNSRTEAAMKAVRAKLVQGS